MPGGLSFISDPRRSEMIRGDRGSHRNRGTEKIDKRAEIKVNIIIATLLDVDYSFQRCLDGVFSCV